MNTVGIVYSSFAVAPPNIVVGKIYQFGNDETGYYISDAKGVQYIDLDEIKMLFTPVNKTWDSVLSTTTKTIEKKK